MYIIQRYSENVDFFLNRSSFILLFKFNFCFHLIILSLFLYVRKVVGQKYLLLSFL